MKDQYQRITDLRAALTRITDARHWAGTGSVCPSAIGGCGHAICRTITIAAEALNADKETVARG